MFLRVPATALLKNSSWIAKRWLSSSISPVKEIKTVGCVGLGLMGHGIAQLSASNGYQVVAVETSEAAIEVGKGRIEGSVDKLLGKSVKKGKMTEQEAAAKQDATLKNISYSTSVSALSECDLIVEAIIEDINIKVPFYENLGKTVKPQAIFASNTSSLAISKMAEASGRPDRFVGLHFFNPVQLMPLTEVIRTDATNTAVFELTEAWAQSLGKTTVSCGDTPGFIVNRLLVPSMAQAVLMVERGDATVKDVDISMQLGAGYPMGPLTLADYVGLDTCLSILKGWKSEFPTEPAFIVPASLEKMVAAGKLGRKSGEGYYIWDGDKAIAPNDAALS
jgi:3-hydroxyacyl-CoA dehydrogenase